MTSNGYETHSNEEPTRKCPYCDWEGASRGLTFHVLNKSNEAHGEKYETPEGFEASEAEIVGHENVDVKMPNQYETGNRIRYVCDYCGKVCQGSGGLRIHLSHLAGDEAHPEDATERDIESFPQFKVDKEGNLISQDSESLEVATGGALGGESESLEYQDVVPIEELKELRDCFRADEETDEKLDPGEAAERVQAIVDKYE